MGRFLRVLVILFVPLLVLVGCKSGDSNSAGSAAGQSLPADPSAEASDNAGLDGNCPTSNTTSFAKTKFVLHSGLGFGAFHRYLYKPYRNGNFKSGADGRFTAFVKGGLAALFVKREVRLAVEDVKANPTLCKALAAPMAKIGNTVKSALDKLKNGDSSGIDDVNSTITSVENTAKSNGVEIQEDENADLTSKSR